MKDKMEQLMKSMGKSKEAKMSDQDIQAKKDVLKELLEMCMAEEKGRAHNLMDGLKVSVKADTTKGLKEGLEKAEEITQDLDESELPDMEKTDDVEALSPEGAEEPDDEESEDDLFE